MARAQFMLAFDSDSCTLARTTGDGVECQRLAVTAQQPGLAEAEQLTDALSQMGYRGQELCLGLPSQMVLAAQIDTDNLPRKQRRTATIYRLEEQLPLDAEDFTADFLPVVGGMRLALAAATGPVEQLLESLTDCGVAVGHICPSALLVGQGLHLAGRDAGDYLLVAAGEHLEIFRMASGVPLTWYTVEARNPASLLQCIRADLLARPTEAERAAVTTVGDLDEAHLTALADDGLSVTRDQAQPADLMMRASAAMLTGRNDWVDFRRDKLAMPNPWQQLTGLLRAVAASTIILLALLTITFTWQATRHASLAQKHRTRMRAVHRDLYPNTKTPSSPLRFLRSQLDQLSGLNGQGHGIPHRPNALKTLRDVVANLPDDVRLRITEMRLAPTGVFMHGEVLTFAHAEQVARQLGEAGFVVDPPRSERREQGAVTFNLSAALPAGPQPEDAP